MTVRAAAVKLTDARAPCSATTALTPERGPLDQPASPRPTPPAPSRWAFTDTAEHRVTFYIADLEIEACRGASTVTIARLG
jgi:hypothetical protein